MSEFNDLMLDGVICQCCGQFVGDAVGFPRSCGWCETLELQEHTGLNEPTLETGESATTREELDDDLPF